jgi:hypothetical protein
METSGRLAGGRASVSGAETGEEVVLDTLVPPVEESAGEVTIQAKLTWRVAQNEVVSEESRCTLSFQRAGKSQVRPLRADRFRIWQGRIPRPDREFHPALEKKFLAKSYILTFPGTKGQARPEYFPSASQGLDLSTPLKAKYEEGAWNIEIRFNSADTKRPKVLEGVLEPGPSGGSPVWISVRVP